MKYRVFEISAIILLIFITSCSKKTEEEVKEKIDSASQVLGRDVDTLINKTIGKDSIYDTAPVEVVKNSAGKDTRPDLNDIFDEYIDIRDELADDDSVSVNRQADELNQALLKTQTDNPDIRSDRKWRTLVSQMEKINAELRAAKTLKNQKSLFSELSGSVEEMILAFGLNNRTVYKAGCDNPALKNKFWLTDSKDRLNPYYGKDKANANSKSCIYIIKAWKFE